LRHLIIYAHPNPASFSHAIKETLVEAYQAAGSEVVVRDLYALGFDAILKGSDFEGMKAGNLPADIAEEQGHIQAADVITVVAPVWWASYPAIFKGYIDRVFLPGFAYQYGANGAEGLLTGKKVLLISCHGHPNEVYDATGMHGSINQTQDDGIYRFCGMDVLPHVYFGGVPMTDDATRKGYLEQVKETAARHFGAVTA